MYNIATTCSVVLVAATTSMPVLEIVLVTKERALM